MLYGIGTDILNIHQIESSVSDLQDPFVRKIYTPAEIELIESRPSRYTAMPHVLPEKKPFLRL